MIGTIFSSNEKSLFKANLKYGLIGVITGILISVFSTTFYNKAITAKEIAINILFSVAITLSITNSVYFFERFLKPSGTSFWRYIGGFYCCNLAGMFIGTEISHILICLIFKIPFTFNDRIVDYKFNFFVVIVVGSLLLVYHAQSANLQSLLKNKELDLAKAEKLKSQAELQMLQSKINPHFLYNSLNSIASLIHEHPDKAEEMTLKLSKLFRYSINSAQESLTSIKEETDIVNTYLDIEKIRFGKRINFQVQVGPGLEDQLIPRFLVQPLVENALKHGLKDVEKDGMLKVDIQATGTQIVITVGDNGARFPDELNIGYGLQSTYDKLQLLYADGYEIKISNVPEKQIKITIPANA